MPLLSVENLSIQFGQSARAVSELSLAIEPGECLGLVGESGSGKSVTSLAILRLLAPGAVTGGRILWQGAPGAGGAPVDLLRLAPEPMRRLRGSAISMIFQEPMTALNPVLPVGRQIAEAITAHSPRLGRAELRERVYQAMHEVALPDPRRRARDYPHQFSGGQRQRVLIAMALVHRPQLLIADEPTTALDVTVQAQILELLASLRERFGLAMLFISHDLAVVSRLADRVAVMRNGLLLEQGPARAIFEAPLHPYTRSLLGAVPTLATPLGQPLATVSSAASLTAGVLREAEAGHWVRG